MIESPPVASDVVWIGGCPISRLGWAPTLEFIRTALSTPTFHHVHTANVDHIMIAQKDAEFARILRRAELVTADGAPLLWAARALGHSIPERVTGSDLVPMLCEHSAQWNIRLYFLGAAPGVADAAAEAARKKYPGVRVVGTYSPSPDELADPQRDAAIVKRINQSGANTLLVALGAPKQEKWLDRHRHDLQTRVNIGIGASLDFLAGKVLRAPRWMQKIGLEWLYRLGQEPGRLWRRYLIEDTRFIYLVGRQLLGRRSVR